LDINNSEWKIANNAVYSLQPIEMGWDEDTQQMYPRYTPLYYIKIVGYQNSNTEKLTERIAYLLNKYGMEK
jgi:hypothetical protein